MILYSIIICTYNRSEYLFQTIDSVWSILQYRSDFEILIIDNNSTDNTSETTSRFKHLSSVKYFKELNQGLSHARNRGIKECSGEILIFLDDDIEIKSDFFDICDKVFSRNEINIIGGKVLPFKVEIPQWLPEKFYYLASIFDIGNSEKFVSKVMGANYGMRKSVANKTGLYNTNLGRKGNVLSGGEEVEYLNRASSYGYNILYVPELVVYHKINNKLNKNYILEYSHQLGKSEVQIDFRNNGLKVIVKLIIALFSLPLYSVSFRLASGKFSVFSGIKTKYSLGYMKYFFYRK